MKKYTIRPCLSTYIILGTLIGFPLLGNAFVYIYYKFFENTNTIIIILLYLFGIIITCVIIYQYKTEIDGLKIITNKSLFNFFIRESINIKEIEKMKIISGYVKGRKKNGFVTLYLIKKRKIVQINIKPYRQNDIVFLVQYIYKHNNDIQMDDLVSEIFNIKLNHM